jgi:DNA-binding NarL/FixJ family response regulator
LGNPLVIGYLSPSCSRSSRSSVSTPNASRRAVEIARLKWRGRLGFAVGPLAEAVVRLGADDTDRLLIDLEQLVHKSGLDVARPQLLRARAFQLLRKGAYAEATGALEASAAVARSHHAVIDLAQTLALLASTARRTGEPAIASNADAERFAIVNALGPTVRGLVWAQRLTTAVRPHGIDRRSVPLSPREREIAALMVTGSSNREIAESLVISERTVEHHVTSILTRLGLETRGQVEVWAHQHGLGPHALVGQAE